MPIEEYVDLHPDCKIVPETYLNYEAEEELYGVFLVIQSKNIEVFKFLWEDRGTLWSEKHLLPVIQHLISNEWLSGLQKFFGYHRTREIFLTMYCNERRTFYEGLSEIAENLLKKKTSRSKKLLMGMMRPLCSRPYGALTFLYMFKYIHASKTKIRCKDVDPSIFMDDMFVIMYKRNEVYEMAEKFDEACGGNLKQKRKYEDILRKLIDFSFQVMPNAIPISRIWKSIKIGSEEDFRRCCKEAKKNMPQVITLRKSPTTMEFKQAMHDDRVKHLSVNKWKPLHLMIYFERLKMIDDIIGFAGRSLRKAMTLENKKLQTGEDFHCLKLSIRLKSPTTFSSLWNLANIWSIKHFYLVIKELSVPTQYSEQIMKTVLEDKTAYDILMY